MITYWGSCGSMPARSSAARIAIAPSSVAERREAAAELAERRPHRADDHAASHEAKLAQEARLGREPPAKATTSWITASRSSSEASSLGGVHVPDRDREDAGRNAAAATWTASGVGVGPSRRDLERMGDPSSSAASTSSSATRGLTTGPRVIAAPEPSSTLPARFGLPPGTSVAQVTSIASATCGSSAKAAVRARDSRSPPARPRPRRNRSARRRPPPPGAPPRARRRRRAGCRAPSRRTARWEARSGRPARPPTSPTRTSSAASSRLAAPMSMCRSECSTFGRSPPLPSNCRRATTPGSRPLAPARSTRCPERSSRPQSRRGSRTRATRSRRCASPGRRSRRCGRRRRASALRQRYPLARERVHRTSRGCRRAPRQRPMRPCATPAPRPPRGRKGQRRSTGRGGGAEWARACGFKQQRLS